MGRQRHGGSHRRWQLSADMQNGRTAGRRGSARCRLGVFGGAVVGCPAQLDQLFAILAQLAVLLLEQLLETLKLRRLQSAQAAIRTTHMT